MATVWLIIVLWLPTALTWSITAVVVSLVLLGLLGYGSPRITLAADTLRAGRARIETEYVGRAEPLDAEAAWRAAGPDVDARAYLLLRPYLKGAVRLEITDPDDPAPYWLLSTRHPASLAAALNGLREHR